DHNYNQTSREAVYQWVGQWLLNRPEAFKEAPYQKEPDAELRVFPDGKLPADASSKEQLTRWLIERSQAQLRALSPTGKRKLTTFKETMLPAWHHTLQLEWPPAPEYTTALSSESDRVDFAIGSHGTRARAR